MMKVYTNDDLFCKDSYSNPSSTYASNTSSTYNSASPDDTSSPFSGYDAYNQEQQHQYLNLYSDFAQQMPQEDLANWGNDRFSKEQSELEEFKTQDKINFLSKFETRLFIILLILIILIFIFTFIEMAQMAFACFVSVLPIVSGLSYVHNKREYLFKRGLVSPALKRIFHFDMDATEVFQRAFSLRSIIEQLQLNRIWNSMTSSDNVLGVVNDLPFYFSDFQLKDSRRKSETIEFKGQIIFLPVFQTHIQDTITITRLGNEINIRTTNAEDNASFLSKLFGISRGETATSTIDGVCSNGASIKDYDFKVCDTNILFTEDFEKLSHAFTCLTPNEINVYDFDGQLNTAFCDALCQFTANYRQHFKIFIMKNIMIILLENQLDPFEIQKHDHTLDPNTVRQRLTHEALWLKSIIYPFATMNNTSSGFSSDNL